MKMSRLKVVVTTLDQPPLGSSILFSQHTKSSNLQLSYGATLDGFTDMAHSAFLNILLSTIAT
jgi:hypothetical protein